jgi:hypothetical protein
MDIIHSCAIGREHFLGQSRRSAGIVAFHVFDFIININIIVRFFQAAMVRYMLSWHGEVHGVV